MSTKLEPTRGPAVAALRIVVGVDLKRGGASALEQAARIGQQLEGSELHVIHVSKRAKTAELKPKLRSFVIEHARAPGLFPFDRVVTHLCKGDPADEIVRLANTVGANLVVLGEGRGRVRHLLEHSVVERVRSGTQCALVVAPRDALSELEVPAILPPCADCVATRTKTKGKTWWCARHATHLVHAHHYSYQGAHPFELHDSEVIPTGA